MKSLNIKYLPELDQLRGLAALLVLYFHGIAGYYLLVDDKTPPVAHNLMELIILNGFTGVTLFFVISGFLFTWGALQSGSFNWRKFYANRILRIYPMYLLMIIVAFSLTRGGFSFGQLLQTLLGFGNLRAAQGDFDIVLWTIAVELQFYMLFPFLLGLLRRRGVRALYGLVAVMLLIRGIAYFSQNGLHDAIYWTLLGRLDQFLLGMIAAWHVYHRGWLKPDRLKQFGWWRLLPGLILSLTAMAAAFWLYTKLGWKNGETSLNVIWPTVEGALWVAFSLCYVGLVRLWHNPLIRGLQFVGMISYSVYILHLPIIKGFERHGWLPENSANPLLAAILFTTLAILPLTILAALVTYYFVEKPSLEMRQQYATFKPGSTDNEGKPAPLVSGSDA